MNTNALLLAVIIWIVCAFAALVYLARRIASVRKYTEQAIERANTRTDERLKKFDNSYIDQFYNLAKRVGKLEDSKICVMESSCSRLTDTDEVGNTSLYAITKVGYSTAIVSLTDDEVAVIESFIDWACLDDDFSAEKLDQDYTPMVWRWRDKQ